MPGGTLWRTEKYWCEKVDYLLKFHIEMITHVFLKFSIKRKKPGQENFVSL